LLKVSVQQNKILYNINYKLNLFWKEMRDSKNILQNLYILLNTFYWKLVIMSFSYI